MKILKFLLLLFFIVLNCSVPENNSKKILGLVAINSKEKASDSEEETKSSTEKTKSSSKIILWSYPDAKQGGEIGGKAQAHALCADVKQHPSSVKTTKLTNHKAFLTFDPKGKHTLPFWPHPKSFTGNKDKIPNSDSRPLYGEDGTTKLAETYNDYFELRKNALASLKTAGTTAGKGRAKLDNNKENLYFLFGLGVTNGKFSDGGGSCDTGNDFWNNTSKDAVVDVGSLNEIGKKRFFTIRLGCNIRATLLCISY